MFDKLQNALMVTVDTVMSCLPQRRPTQQALHSCRIIAHRGAYDNTAVLENTLPAFEKARLNGIWGVECDIRWTSDLVPVISHDADCTRVFANPLQINQLSFEQLRAEVPAIPSLAELVEQFGGRLHLMLEVKNDPTPGISRQKDILRQHLSALTPGVDYHFLALEIQLLDRVDFVDPGCCFLVSELNSSSLSKATIAASIGGLTGHYVLLSNRLKRRHEQQGQRIGTGFVGSKSVLFRELNRGIEWIFSNDAVKIQKIRDQLLEG